MFMQTSATNNEKATNWSKLGPGADNEHAEIAPTSKRPIYNRSLNGENSDEHKIVGPVYERQKLKGEYDFKPANQSKFLNRIKPIALFKILGEHRKYFYIKKFAVDRLDEIIHKQLQLLYNLDDCAKSGFKPNDELSHGIFNWCWNDFLTRRRLQNLVWVDVMQRTNETCLHIYKFQKDLEQLHLYINKIFDGLYSNMEEKDLNIYQDIEKPIDEAKKVLHTLNFVEDELNTNKRIYLQLVHKDQFITSARRQSEEKFVKSYLENRIMGSHIWDPIEVRYQLQWFSNIVQQDQYRMDLTEEKYKNDILNYRNLLERENFIVGNCMDFFYSSIEIYKNRLNGMQDKFDKELEIIDNRLAVKRNQIDRLQEKRKFLIGEIKRFHEEEELMRERELRKAEESERIILEEVANQENKQVKVKKTKNVKLNASKTQKY